MRKVDKLLAEGGLMARKSAPCLPRCTCRKHNRTTKPLRERFLAKVVVDLDAPRTIDDAPCCGWTGSYNSAGYSQLGKGPHGAGAICAHRVAYEMWYGKVPDGLQIDHLCRNHWCVNPAHLEAVTPCENTRRSRGWSWGNGVCPQGHPYDEVYKLHPDGRWNCRVCGREKMRKRRANAKRQSPTDTTGG